MFPHTVGRAPQGFTDLYIYPESKTPVYREIVSDATLNTNDSWCN